MGELLLDFFKMLIGDWSYELIIKDTTINISDLFVNVLVMLTIFVIMYAVYKFVGWIIDTLLNYR